MPTNHQTPIQRELFEMQDIAYRDFHCKLIPNVPAERVIGVRTPQLRRYAAELSKTDRGERFMRELPHFYYEENNLHGFLIERIGDYALTIEQLDRFLPYVDNWATCDMISPKVFAKHLDTLGDQCLAWIASGDTYTVRFGIGMLMKHYLGDRFDRKYLDIVAGIRSEEYYINMMIAWYFATALTRQYDRAVPYIERGALDKWTLNKAIQKACESRMVGDDQKQYLRSLKRR